MKSLKIIAGVLLILSTISAFSQSERDLKQALEGKRVEVLIDMPATEQGINIYVNKEQKINFDSYSNKIKKFGIALFPGDRVMITKIKKKSHHIEFQLGGGGYGTSGDESTHTNAGSVPKSSREKEIEKIIKDAKKNKNERINTSDLEKELNDLKRDRKIEQNRLNSLASRETEAKKSRIEAKRLQGGSRFNIRYSHNVGSAELSAESIMEALEEYVAFENDPPQSVTVLSNTITSSFQKGITMDQAVEMLGMPQSLNSEEACGFKKTTCEFIQDDEITTAIFVENILISYSIKSK